MKLNDIRIQTKVMVMICVPIVALLCAMGYLLFQEDRVRQENSSLYELTRTAPEIANFLQELQKERALSVQFINAKLDLESAAQGRLIKQRASTDLVKPTYQKEMAAILGRDFDQSVKAAIKDTDSKLSELEAFRGQVDKKVVTGDQVAKFYTETNAKVIAIISRMASLSTDSKISMQLIAYYNLVLIKEKSGIERAVGANGLGRGSFSPALHARFIGLSAQQDVHLAIFRERTSPEISNFFNATVTGGAVDEVIRIRKAIVEAGNGLPVEASITPQHWIDVTTQRIDMIHEAEGVATKSLIQLVESTKDAATSRFIFEIVLSVIVLSFTMLLSYFLVRSVTLPLAEANRGLQELANDHLEYKITGDARKDEIGDIARAMLVFKQNALERRRIAALQEEENKIKLIRATRVEELVNAFDSKARDLIGSLSGAAVKMEETSQSMLSIANQTSTQSSAVTSASIQAGANIQNVASAAEELSASIREIAQQMNKSSDYARRAIDSVEKAQETILRLSEAGEKISQVIGLITDIAEQTNLLALNATIEAARAGDAGKGFAVVASEVKSLASQTQKATDDIAEMIRNVQEQTQRAVAVISSVGKEISELNETTSAVAAAVEEQTSATQEISRNVQEAANGTDEVNSGIMHVSDGACKSGEAANEVLSVSKDLSLQSDQMKTSIEKFLSDIRSI